MKKFTASVMARVAAAKAEGYVDSGVKILIAVVIGALLLLGLYELFENVILPSITKATKTMFDSGNTLVNGINASSHETINAD